MGIPKECKMPALSGLDMPLVSRLLLQVFIGEPGMSQKAALYRRNFVRLVDKALREHHEARQAILAQIAEAKRPAKEMAEHGRQIFMLEFTDHMENCINAISRLFKLLQSIKSEKNGAPALPRRLRKLVETKNIDITKARDAVEHIDEFIQKDKIASDEPIMLAVTENDDGVMIANYEIKFEELAMVLKKMHEIALYILTAKKIEGA